MSRCFVGRRLTKDGWITLIRTARLIEEVIAVLILVSKVDLDKQAVRYIVIKFQFESFIDSFILILGR